jgi:hypothetical protein
METEEKQLTIREKITLVLVLFLVKMLKPYKFDSDFKDTWEEVTKLVKSA